ncbi:MAG: polysaccharide biosynthesis protein, partial [Bacteroidales bacterium]|nr:polysaccharide biosynthesis protein [Bacteroidales bacterium]
MHYLTKLTRWYFSKKALPYWGILSLDCAIVMFSGYVATYLAYSSLIGFLNDFWPVTLGLILTTLFCVVGFKKFHTFSGIVRYSSFVDLGRILAAMGIGGVLTLASSIFFYAFNCGQELIIIPGFKRICVIFILSTLLIWFVRIVVKVLYDSFRTGKSAHKAYVYGIREGGISLAKSIRNLESAEYAVEGFIRPDGDETPAEWILGVKVRNEDDDLIPSMQRHNVDTIIVSPLQTDNFREKNDLINQLLKNKINILMASLAQPWDGKSDLSSQLRKVDIEDLLPREQIKIDMDAIGALLTGKKILITGAAGSIGSEMVRQVAVYNPAEMILIDQAETPMHDIRLMMKNKFPSIKAATIVTSITNKEHMEIIFSEHRPDYVFHAAAYKHVPMMEDNPGMAVQNNIYGTRVIADLAVKYETKKFVMISTDKAVNPTNV